MQKTLERKSVKTIDFNCDLAQGYGVYRNTNEYEFLDYVSSVNVSCGFHAGDPMTIKNALLAAKEKNVVIGAHIGYHDIQGFGYRPIDLTEEELEALVVYQVSALLSFAKAYKLEIEHVRPHGAMYRRAGEDFRFATVLARAIQKSSQWLTYVAPAGDVTEKVGDYVKIPVAQEIMLDKVYTPDLMVDYEVADIVDTEASIKRLQHFLHTSQIDNNTEGKSYVEASTIHFSNKHPNSLEILQRAKMLITPEPVNYGRVKASGWVD